MSEEVFSTSEEFDESESESESEELEVSGKPGLSFVHLCALAALWLLIVGGLVHERESRTSFTPHQVMNIFAPDILEPSARALLDGDGGGLPRKRIREFLARTIYESLSRRGQVADDTARTLASLIVAESTSQRFDPLFAAAVIRTESAFRATAVSSVGAKGLMQIMPDTQIFIERRLTGEKAGSIYSERDNLRLGIAYLKHLEFIYGGNRAYALISYNWGPGNLNAAIAKQSTIPGSVISYAKTILEKRKEWENQLLL